MNKLIFILHLLFLITNVFTASLKMCEDFGKELRRRLSTDNKVTLKDCEKLTTTSKKKKCTVNSKGTACEEIDRVDSECNNKVISNDRRRLSTTELTDSDCKDLKTSSSKYKCVATEDKESCVEVEGSNRLKLSFAILCLLLFL